MAVASGKWVARSKCSLFTDYRSRTPTPPHICVGVTIYTHLCAQLLRDCLSQAPVRTSGRRGAASPLTPQPTAAPTVRLPAPSQLRGCGPQITSVSPHPSRSLRSQWLGQLHFSLLFPKRDQPRRPFERAVITSSFVGNGISMAHGRASVQWGLRQ